MTTAILTAEGPFEIPFTTNERGSKHIASEDGREFFDAYDDLADQRGCYLFAIRSRGLRAAYVGVATKAFEREVFTSDKLQKYNQALHLWPHGTPVLLLVVAPPGRGTQGALLHDVEEFLIRSAKRAWPELLNKHHTGPDAWEIDGVTTSHRGRRSEGERALAKLLKFEEP